MAEVRHQFHDKAFINGEWVGANTTFDVFNPATEELLARVPDMSESETETAIKHAHAAFQTWKHTTPKVWQHKVLPVYRQESERYDSEFTSPNGGSVRLYLSLKVTSLARRTRVKILP